MGYVEAFEAMGILFPEAIVISTPAQINQSGLYLLFDGSKSASRVRDNLSFTLAIAANSLKKESGVMAKVDEIRNKVMQESLLDWEETRSVSFETGTLFVVACGVVYNLDYRSF